MNSVARNLKIDSGVAPADFRDAMRSLAGGVSVITVGREHDVTGMTVTSVSSFAVDPPTLIVCVNLKSSSWALLQKYNAFGVNILHADQADIALKFSGAGGAKGGDRFASAEWMSGLFGTPLLVGALAAIDCQVDEVILRHSHAIVIGRVRDLKVSENKAALAYWRGRYLERSIKIRIRQRSLMWVCRPHARFARSLRSLERNGRLDYVRAMSNAFDAVLGKRPAILHRSQAVTPRRDRPRQFLIEYQGVSGNRCWHVDCFGRH